jgi:1,4-dihydroxy-2-naphthoyl-CoA hydrolase
MEQDPMGEQTGARFPQEVIDEYAALGVDLPALFSAGHLGTRMGVQIVEASAERVVGTLPVEGNTQPYGLLHGGASVVLAETLGSFGSVLHAGPQRIAVGIDINATHHRAARSGVVTGTARPLHLGSTMASWRVEIVDEAGKPVCTSRITCLLRDVAPGA